MSGRHLIYRHRLWVRISHWLNLVSMTVLLLSGLQIFNAHPALYWGARSTFDHPLLAMTAGQSAAGEPVGRTTILSHPFDTTGLLGASREGGEIVERGFPAWATLPSNQWLAMGRRWHFFFAWIFIANGLLYAAHALLTRHIFRDLLPSRRELAGIGHSILEHARLRFPTGEEARRYNVIQKLTYLTVAFVLGPVMVLAGLAMSPSFDAGFPVVLDLFGGRQSARLVHFICAFLFLGFVAIHLLMVVLSGPWNNLRSMVTGWYDTGPEGGRP
jgi:thiosulfate reductase cytochrome b subunit